MKNCEDLDSTMNLYIAFNRMAIFTILILQTHEHRGTSHLLISSSISFFNVLKFLSYNLSLAWFELPEDNLFYFLRLLWKVLFPWFLSHVICHLNKGRLLIFMSSFCIQLFYWKFYQLKEFLYGIFGVIHVCNHIICK